MVMITTTPANSDPFSGTWLRLLVEAGFGTADTNPPAGLSFFKRTVNAPLLFAMQTAYHWIQGFFDRLNQLCEV